MSVFDVSGNILINNGGVAYENPVASLAAQSKGLPDPCVVKDGFTFYSFTTQTKISVMKSVDLVNWKYIGDAVTDDDYSELYELTGNTATKIWAPCVIKHGNLWIMYASVVAGNTATNCHMCVFTSAKPDGKWKYRGELFNATTLSLNDCIDADVVMDSNGDLYMFVGSSYGIYLIKLSNDGLTWDNSLEKVLIHPHTPSGDNGTRLEASCCHWREGYYYLFNSAGIYTQGGGYHVVVSRSSSLQGEYLNKSGGSLVNASNTGTTILSGNASLTEPGHNSGIITDSEGNDWMMFHAWNGSYRELCLQRIYWDEDGWPYFTNGTVASNGISPIL